MLKIVIITLVIQLIQAKRPHIVLIVADDLVSAPVQYGRDHL